MTDETGSEVAIATPVVDPMGELRESINLLAEVMGNYERAMEALREAVQFYTNRSQRMERTLDGVLTVLEGINPTAVKLIREAMYV